MNRRLGLSLAASTKADAHPSHLCKMSATELLALGYLGCLGSDILFPSLVFRPSISESACPTNEFLFYLCLR